MHPFLPASSLILLALADFGAVYWRLNAGNPDLAMHRAALFTVIGTAILFGTAAAVWLWKLRLRFPLWIAGVSAVFVLAAALFPVNP